MYKNLLLFTLLFGVQLLSAQQKAMTFGVNSPSLIDEMMPFIEGRGNNGKAMLEEQSVKAYMMPVRRAPSGGSDLCYLAASLLEYYVNLDRNYKVNLSPDYLSLNLQSRGKAIKANDVFSFLGQDGTVSAAILPYGAQELHSGVYATTKYKIDNYLHLFNPDSGGRVKVFELRKALMRGNPALVELRGSEEMQAIRNQREWEPISEGDKSYYFIVVGYDEKTESFELMSCWGKDWAGNGYISVAYDLFSKRARNGYVIVPSAL